MAKFDVVDLDLKKVAEIELSDEVFAAEPNEHLFYEVAKMQQINRRRGTVGGEEHLAGLRRRQEALEAEGHRPRPSGLDPRLALGRRRQGDGPQAPRLLLPSAPQGPPRRAPRGAVAARRGEDAHHPRRASTRTGKSKAGLRGCSPSGSS